MSENTQRAKRLLQGVDTQPGHVVRPSDYDLHTAHALAAVATAEALERIATALEDEIIESKVFDG